MRAPTEMPRRRRRTGGRGRVLIVVGIVVLFLLVTSLRGVARFYTDYLWFQNLHLSSVFTGILGAKVALAIIFTLTFFVMCFVSLTVADRTAPPVPPDRARGRAAHPLPRLRRAEGVAGAGARSRCCSD